MTIPSVLKKLPKHTKHRFHTSILKVHFDRYLILSARRTVIAYNEKFWTRKDRPDDWDITIGSKDSAEITDLVGVFILHKIGLEFPGIRGGGLYRDDILLTVVNCSNVVIESLTYVTGVIQGR